MEYFQAGKNTVAGGKSPMRLFLLTVTRSFCILEQKDIRV
jgi:hypothetical protein